MNPFRLLNDDISFDDISCNDISSNDAPMTPKPPRKLTFGNMLSTPRSSPKFGRKSPNKSKSAKSPYKWFKKQMGKPPKSERTTPRFGSATQNQEEGSEVGGCVARIEDEEDDDLMFTSALASLTPGPLDSTLQSNRSEKSEMEVKIVDLEGKLVKSESEKKILEEEKNQQETETELLVKEAENKNVLIANLMDLIASKDADLARSLKESVELKEAVSVLTKKNSEANLEIVALKRDKLDNENQATEQLDYLEAKLLEAGLREAEFKSNYRNSELQATDYKEKLRETELREADLKSKLRETELREAELQTKLNEAELREAELQSKLNEAKEMMKKRRRSASLPSINTIGQSTSASSLACARRSKLPKVEKKELTVPKPFTFETLKRARAVNRGNNINDTYAANSSDHKE
jgi:uncharacterized protein YjbI with pentapeptide repeats